MRSLPTAKALLAFGLLLTTLAVVSPAVAAPVVRNSTTPTSQMLRIASRTVTSPPPGCVQNCPALEGAAPSLAAGDPAFEGLVGATKIDTYSVPDYSSPTPNTRRSGGCAIVGGGLRCWGSNLYGQLGDETLEDSTSPRVAVSEGVQLSGITDVATDGTSTCVVIGGALKCIGQGRFTPYTRIYSSIMQSTTEYVGGVVTNATSSSSCVIQTKDGATVLSSDEGVSGSRLCTSASTATRSWATMRTSGVVKVVLGGTGPTICVLTTTATVECGSLRLTITPNVAPDMSTSSAWDCDGDTANGFESTTRCSGDTYRVTSTSRSESVWDPASWTWASADQGAATDLVMPTTDGPASRVCVAATRVSCATLSDGSFHDWTIVEGSDGAESVYIAEGETPGLCVHGIGVMRCGAGSRTIEGFRFPKEVTPIAVMEKPLSVFISRKRELWKVYFALPSGLLSADSWVMNCNGCYRTTGTVLTPVTQFESSTSSSFNSVIGLTGATDSEDFLPVKVRSGARKLRTNVSVTVRTDSGIALEGSTVKWTAPDLSDTLGSSSSKGAVTDSTGKSTGSLLTGPVTFTFSGGTMPNGVTLHAATVTVDVADTGNVTVEVPTPPELVRRRVSVVLPDGAPVPSAVIALRNTYFTHAYRADAVRSVVWAVQKPDTRGWFASPNCVFCFVPPPEILTGGDGIATFSSFDPGTRTGSYDFDVTYDDGALLQKVKHTATGLNESVSMPFMARVDVVLPDGDVSTPMIDVTAKESTAVSVPIRVKDADGLGIDGLALEAESVCATMNSGGLWSSTVSLTDICSPPAAAAAGAPTGGVSVAAARGCSTAARVVTDGSGKAVVRLCAKTSQLVRLRAKGVVASVPICIRVAGKPCVLPGSKDGSAKAPTSMKRGSRLATKDFTKFVRTNALAGKVSVAVIGRCSLSGTRVIASRQAGVCKVTVLQAPKGKVKGVRKTFTVRIF